MAEKNAISHRGAALKALAEKLKWTLYCPLPSAGSGRACARPWGDMGRAVAQLGSAPALGAGGRRFESGRPDQCAAVVQLVEPQPSKLIVAGSSPVRRSSLYARLVARLT